MSELTIADLLKLADESVVEPEMSEEERQVAEEKARLLAEYQVKRREEASRIMLRDLGYTPVSTVRSPLYPLHAGYAKDGGESDVQREE